MNPEIIVCSRPDREIRKKIITPGDYSLVPYEDSRCKIRLSDVKCTGNDRDCSIEAESRIFSSTFDGNVLIGDCDCFIDKDFELLLQQMCCGETCFATLVYRDSENKLVKEISCTVELIEVMEEQVVSDWSWQRLHETSVHHKERGVALIKEKRIADAFRRFSKSLKMLIAIEPIDPELIDDEKLKELVDLKVKLYNNLAHCQLQFQQYDAALDLCNHALNFEPENVKSLYRRCMAYAGLNQNEEAWADIQHVLAIDPKDKAALHMATTLKPKLEQMNQAYTKVIKKMFS